VALLVAPEHARTQHISTRRFNPQMQPEIRLQNPPPKKNPRLASQPPAITFHRTSRWPQESSRSISWPKTTVPLPLATATCDKELGERRKTAPPFAHVSTNYTCVESAVHAISNREPQSGCSRECDQPVLSQRRSMLNEPTAK
jgi:hypothetical protein